MRVISLTASNFTPAHKKLAVKFPEKGIVVVSGPNGSGKTAIIEAIAWGLYGKTVRGTDPSRDEGTMVAITVEIDGKKLNVIRDRKRGKKMTVLINDVEYDTAQKAQEELDKILPSYDMWLRSSVLASDDATKFTAATDAERKRTFEAVLGLDAFDVALDSCRADIKAAESIVSAATTAAAVAQATHAAANARADEAHRALLRAIDEVANAAAAHEEQVTQARLRFKNAKADYAALLDDDTGSSQESIEEERTDLWAKIGEAENAVKVAERSLHQLTADARVAESTCNNVEHQFEQFEDGNCPTCERPMADEWRMSSAEMLSNARLEASQAKTQLLNARDSVRSTCDKHNTALHTMRQRIRELDTISNTVANQQRKLSTAKAAKDSLKAQLDRLLASAPADSSNVDQLAERCNTLERTAKKAAAEATAKLEEVNQKAITVAVLRTTEKVLGTKGVRARLVDDAVAALGQTADRWIKRISDDKLSIDMSVSGDSILLGVLGSGDDKSYKSCSAGQRRRVDIAIMFALSEVVAGAARQHGASVFADEVFDALDAGGTRSVIEAIEELASDRMVMVITHRRDLESQIPAANRIVFGAA